MNQRIRRLYWQLTALSLAAYLSGWAPGIHAAIALTVVQTIHFAWRSGSARTFEVQVRIGYLGLLLVGLLPPLWPVHAVQLVGVNALLVADYCPLARLLALAPWNRAAPLTADLVRWIVLAPPQPGSILDRMHAGVPRMRARTTVTPPARERRSA
jgi:hypothetical protein